jgi:hypothetical protein
MEHGRPAIVQPMPHSKDDAARDLAEWHFGVEPDLKEIIRIVANDEDALDEPIKLLEVNAAAVATGAVVRSRVLRPWST